MTRRAPARLPAAAALLALTGAIAGCGVLDGTEQRSLTARFDRTVGLYEESDVRVLGVKIGQVTEIVPEGDTVRVEMTYDSEYEIPADAKAVVVAPSIVSDRYVQLTPVYREGPVLPDDADLGTDRTAVPVELDQIYDSFNELNLALGPQGANKDGALSDLIEVSARNLEGNGELLGTTLTDFSQGLTALSDSRSELFGTVANLADFTNTLARRDETVRAFNADLADVADQLEGEREDLATAVESLSLALGDVAGFVRENKEDLTANVSDLAEATRFLTERQTELEEFLSVAPTALSNLQLAYNPNSGTLDTRDNTAAMAETEPLAFLCNLLNQAGTSSEQCDQVTELITGGPPGGGLPLPGLPLPGVPLPGGAAAPAGAVPAAERDLSLGGILDGGR